ncbi:hypothetical protein C2G38_2191781 [Gigaspora rosea]|uniref:Uncharacterized protein n=1 Tax=Gigaspora rosea TaxID=44941 RepID=A0A397V2W0_9GLOM|nr:hypothetical protein C2G38_2191781 [Gigaspora rosea]
MPTDLQNSNIQDWNFMLFSKITRMGVFRNNGELPKSVNYVVRHVLAKLSITDNFRIKQWDFKIDSQLESGYYLSFLEYFKNVHREESEFLIKQYKNCVSSTKIKIWWDVISGNELKILSIKKLMNFKTKEKIPEHYEIKPTVPDSLDTEKWNNYRKELSNFLEYMNLTPIYSELVLIDNILNEFPSESDQKIIDEYKKTVKNKNRPNTKHSRKYNNTDLKKKSDTSTFYQKKGTHSPKFPMSILTDKDITPIIDEFKDLFKDFLKI